jgi:glycerophosphoryl diester phosphodiesterase
MMIIAHRGFSSRAPENTMAAFKAALAFGVDGLELDVHLSRDGEPVICHDETVDRTTDGHGLIKDYTWQELQKLDAGSWFDPRFADEKIPRLSELLELIKGTNLLVNIELKTNIFPYPGIEEKVVRMVRDFGLVKQCIISSFNHYSLIKISTLAPELKTGALYDAVLYSPWNYALTFGAAALHPPIYSVTPETVAQAKLKGLLVNTWTVDEPVAIERALTAQVDGIITNRPDRVREILDKKAV